MDIKPIAKLLVVKTQTPRLVEEMKLMSIEKQKGRTLAEAPKESRITTFGAAELLALALTVGFVGLCVALILFMIAIV